jgi:hypothetical protein
MEVEGQSGSCADLMNCHPINWRNDSALWRQTRSADSCHDLRPLGGSDHPIGICLRTDSACRDI